MTEEQIERRAERAMDRLDERYMRGELTEAQYTNEVRELDEWAQREYRRAR